MFQFYFSISLGLFQYMSCDTVNKLLLVAKSLPDDHEIVFINYNVIMMSLVGVTGLHRVSARDEEKCFVVWLCKHVPVPFYRNRIIRFVAANIFDLLRFLSSTNTHSYFSLYAWWESTNNVNAYPNICQRQLRILFIEEAFHAKSMNGLAKAISDIS